MEDTRDTINKNYILLIVDDDPAAIWQRIIAILQEFGSNTVVLHPPVVIIDEVKKYDPDLILTVWNDQISSQIYNLMTDYNYYDIPVIAVANEPSFAMLTDMVKIGVTDCLRDRTPIELIQARITTALKTKLLSEAVHDMLNLETKKDSLTGLWNHAHFYDLLAMEISRSGRNQRNISVLMLDIDNFKQLNDTYGHRIGDHVLTEWVLKVKSRIRQHDVLSRYGGEEFSIILPETDRKIAFHIADRICLSLNESMFTIKNHQLKVTVSIGVATYPDDSVECETLVDAADMALYQAKRSGRNRRESVRQVRFEFKTDKQIISLGVGGDFNAWHPDKAAFTRINQDSGLSSWSTAVLLPTGRNRYKFRQIYSTNDETVTEWFTDPANPSIETDPMGQKNSIISVATY